MAKLPSGQRALRRATNALDEARDNNELTEEQRTEADRLFRATLELWFQVSGEYEELESS